VREADLSFVAPSGDFKSNRCTRPLAFVFNKIELAVQNLPNDFSAGNEFHYLLFAVMVGFVTIGELSTKFVGAALNSRFPRPPSADVVDCGEGFFRTLVYRKCGGEILTLHGCTSPFVLNLVE